ncbi:MAG: hypothetical protein J6B88_05305 [Clostridia bacterium]|nr:hypothetical protein [Clostridia bacterium]
MDNGNTADGSESSEEDANAFYTFINEANAPEYKNWCEANKKSIGDLFTTKYGL